MKIKIITLSLGILLFFTACSHEEQINQKENIKTVFAIYPTKNDTTDNRVFSAFANANNQIKLSFKVDGNLEKFALNIGDEVKKGELIATLDSKPYEIKVSQIKYALSEAKASKNNALSTYERVKKLYVNQNASTSDIDNAKAQYEASSAKVENINQQLEYLKLQLSYTKLYAPFNGYISSKFVQENENVQAGTPIALLSDKLVDEVDVQIPENLINKLKIDDSVKVKFDSIDSLFFDAKISEIAKFPAQKEKTYLVIVKLLNSTQIIKSGMSAEVYFDFENIDESKLFYIPTASVLNDKNGYFVYVLQKEKEYYLIKRKDVEVGNLTSEGYEIRSGIKDDDLVLKAGMSEVFENMKVNIGNQKELGN